MAAGAPPDIFGYLSHRDWLRDAWAERKAREPRFSHRYIAMKAGFSSSSLFADLLRSGRRITPSVAMRLAEIFGLHGDASRYFETLVLYDQSETEAERRRHLETLVALRRSVVPDVQADQMELFSYWWNLAVRELLDCGSHEGDPVRLARRIVPAIRAEQAARALDLLGRLGLAGKGDDGIWRKKENVLTADGNRHQRVRDFQREALRLGLEAMDRFEPGRSDLSTLTLSVSGSTWERIRERVASVRREILEMARLDDRADRVVQVNFQAFPMSRESEADSE